MPEQRPLTDEQIEYFSQECETSFRRGAKWATKRALVGYLILLVGVFAMYWNGQHVSGTERGAIVESGRAVTVEGCNRDYLSIGRLRGLLLRANAQVDAQRDKIPADQYQIAKKFYSEELSRLHLPDCRKAKFLLTSDPNRPIKQPTPLHPPAADVAQIERLANFRT